MKRNGSALIIVLWVIALSSVLISGFAFDMHLEAKVVSFLRKKLKAEYLAKAGVEQAYSLVTRSLQIAGVNDSEDTKAKSWYDSAKRLRQGYAIIALTHPLGEGTVSIDIVPEPALRNINSLKDEDWERILKVGGVPEELWSGLIDSFNDWRDGDDQPSLDGAETDDYYARLSPPYKARGRKGKPGNLDTLDELLLIKGFTRSILYGGTVEEGNTNSAAMGGISDLLTALPEAGVQVNINAASKRVLLTLPGIDEIKAEAIIAEREGLTLDGQIGEDAFFTDPNNLFSRIPELNTMMPEDMQYLRSLVNTLSSVLRITSVGRVKGVESKIVTVMGIRR
jgi:type II secretory pathway component PulK